MSSAIKRQITQLGLIGFPAFALVFFALMVRGMILQGYLLPTADLWLILFQIEDNWESRGLRSLLDLHNEHRIVLTRIILLANAWSLGGSLPPLIALNGLLTVLLWATFLRVFRQAHPARPGNLLLFASLISLPIFSFVQKENLLWAFQSQFFLTYLLPLWTFILLAAASKGGINRVQYLFVLILLVACAGTMANGILAAPVAFLLAVILALPRRRIFPLAVLALTIPTLYLLTLDFDPGGASKSPDWFDAAFGFTPYFLTLLGSPWANALPFLNLALIQIWGALILSLSALLCWTALKLSPDNRPREALPLIAYLLYLGLSMSLISFGRIQFGVEQALSPRYSTPVLAFTVTLLLLAWILPANPFRWLRRACLALLSLSFLILVPHQFQSTGPDPIKHFDRAVGVLGLTLGLNDHNRAKAVAPFRFWDKDLAAFVDDFREERLGIFGQPPFDKFQDAFNRQFAPAAGGLQAHAALMMEINGTTDWYALEGWVFRTEDFSPPQTILIVDSNGQVVGAGLTGKPRPDVALYFQNPRANLSGFIAYLRKEYRDSSLYLIDADHALGTSLDLPPSLLPAP